MDQTFTDSKIKTLQQLQQCSGVNLRTAAEKQMISLKTAHMSDVEKNKKCDLLSQN